MSSPHLPNEENSSPTLPPEIPAFLVRSIPQRSAWQWLQNEERSGLLQSITRGFQKAPTVLRQPIVRSRLTDILLREEELFTGFLQIWGEAAPAVVEQAKALPEDHFQDELRALILRNGLAASTAALLFLSRRDALEQLDTIEEPEVTTSSVAQLDVAQTTSTHEETSALQKQLKEAQKRADAIQRRADENQKRVENLKTELATQKSQNAQETRELQTRLKAAERNAAKNETDLAEAQKNLDRTQRRLRQSETTLEETQAENKKLHRQLRQSQQLHEELRKQIAGLTLRLRELENTAQKTLHPVQISEQTKATVEKPVAPKPIAKSPKEFRIASTQKAKIPKLKSLEALQEAALIEDSAAQSITSVPIAAPSSRPSDIHPLDQVFVWNADGHTIRVTARELMNSINRNNEEQVYSVVQAMDALRDQSIEGYRLFISRVREAGRYYGRVITTETTRVLVDASNVARYEKDARGRGQLCNLLAMREELRRRDCFPIKLIADASLPFNIDERSELLAMAKRSEIEIAPAGIEADEILAREARRTGAYVVTNDRNFHLKVAPDFEPPRLSFRVRDGVVTLEDF